MNLLITLNAMKFHAFHGVSPQEETVGNTFTVDISYAFRSLKACLHDDINETVSYADVYNIVQSEMKFPSHLLEHVAVRILIALKTRFPQLSYLKISVSKLNPPLEGEVQSATAVIEQHWD